ncbi:MAG TPA: hypothetical protein VMU11_02320 [Verrucomicrobiae bacterium]|nr:hypothetical protein [Verrucomicrobiae bacterium]
MDVEAVPKRTPDPEARLFAPGVRWFVVSSTKALEDMNRWKDIPAQACDRRVAFVAIEALRERLHLVDWETSAMRIFFLFRAHFDEGGFPDGEVTGSARYRLRDLAAKHDLDAAGHPMGRGAR